MLKLPVRSLSVAAGRRFVMEVLAAAPDERVWAVVQCTSELLTNALAAAVRCAIVMALGHFAHTVFDDHKIVYALLPANDPLTEDERAAAPPQRAVIGGEVTP